MKWEYIANSRAILLERSDLLNCVHFSNKYFLYVKLSFVYLFFGHLCVFWYKVMSSNCCVC